MHWPTASAEGIHQISPGYGVDPAHIHRIFDPFFTTENR
jgi:signal transduction histidine kinase